MMHAIMSVKNGVIMEVKNRRSVRLALTHLASASSDGHIAGHMASFLKILEPIELGILETRASLVFSEYKRHVLFH